MDFLMNFLNWCLSLVGFLGILLSIELFLLSLGFLFGCLLIKIYIPRIG